MSALRSCPGVLISHGGKRGAVLPEDLDCDDLDTLHTVGMSGK